MNRDCALFLLRLLHPFLSNVIWWRRPVHKLQIQVLNTLLDELLPVICRLIKSDDKGDSQFLEDGHVIIGSEGAVSVRHVEGPRESNKLTRNDPVQVAVLDPLKVLVLLHVELGVVVPAERNRVLHSKERVQDGMFVRAGAHCRVTEWHEFCVVRVER